jgi:hypothetical protein
MKTIGRCFWAVLDWSDYVWTLARLTVLDWPLGREPETPTDRATREEGERLRKAFPEMDFDHSGPRRSSSDDARFR